MTSKKNIQTDRFKAGRISRIKVIGFMTYDDLQIIPKQGLNLIIGLNGSGKSSIMSAICLGLGGKPANTSKATQLSDFIKFGHSKATIEIELEEPKGRNVLIVRTIQNDNRSFYFLNGSSANQADVMIVLKKYNIDVTNLCQFLPQEKVAEFSKMNKGMRLENMLQAIGEPDICTTFNELKQMRNECDAREKTLKGLETSKESDVQRNTRLKIEVEKHEERKRLQVALSNMEVRKNCMRYEASRENYNLINVEKKKLQNEAQKMENDIRCIEEEMRSCVTARDNCINQIKSKQQRIKKLTNMLSEKSSLLVNYHEKVELAKVDFKTVITEKVNQQKRLDELQKQILGLREQYEELKKEEANTNAQIAQNLTNHEAIRRELSTIEPKIEEINQENNRLVFHQRGVRAEIAKMKNEEEKKMQILERRFLHTYKAVKWLQQNMQKFKKIICYPALLSINVSDHQNSKFIENNVNIRDLLAFVCQDKDDTRVLTNTLREQMNLRINVALAPDVSLSNFRSPRITSEMQRCGIQCFLNDLFTAPDPVMCYLCQIYNLHRIPICNANAEKNVEPILSTFRTFFTQNERISGVRSKYGDQNLSVKRDHIQAKNILINTMDQSEQLQRLEDQLKASEMNSVKLKNQCDDLVNNRSALEKSQEKLREERAELNEKGKKVKNIHMQLKQRTEVFRKKEMEVIDEQEEKAKQTQKICELNKLKMRVLADQCSMLKEFHVLKIAVVKHIPLAKVFSRKVTDLVEKKRDLDTEFKTVEKKLHEKIQEYDRVKAFAKNLYEKLKATEKELLNSSLSNTELSLEEIEQKIANIKAQLDLNCEENLSAVEEYEEIQRNIFDAEKEILNVEKALTSLKDEMEKKKHWWLQKIEKHINNINSKFTQYYKLLSCAGEISLDKTDDPNNFPKYGLKISLKYRADEGFMELSQTHHSGGECSVAAIIFILSLQELTNVPFRCIDEINQGMDAVNERKIYELIADASRSGSSCSQYFLLTPKLLMDLAYNRDVAVHIIYNSQFLHQKLNVRKHLHTVKEN